MSQARHGSEGHIPFGGDDIEFDERRPNPCYVCGRSRSEKWDKQPCAFCVGSESDE